MNEGELHMGIDVHSTGSQEQHQLPEAFRAKIRQGQPVVETAMTPEQILQDRRQMAAIESETESFVGHKPE